MFEVYLSRIRDFYNRGLEVYLKDDKRFLYIEDESFRISGYHNDPVYIRDLVRRNSLKLLSFKEIV